VLEVVGVDLDGPLLAGWRARVERARRHLGWDAPPLAIRVPREIVARPHASGTSLAIAAPFDQLFTATEVNEWALCAGLLERDPCHWSGLPDALLAAAREEAAEPDKVLPPVLEERAALARFERLAAAELRTDIRALVEAAESRGVRHILDEDTLTLGAGAGGLSWPLCALPKAEQVPWSSLHEIPVVVVTGSNGKTTTVRLIAACARAHGWADGFSCTDGVFIGRALVDAGDYSGPAGTRRVLRDPRVEAAVLETARGGILRRGLAVDHATAAVVTNVSSDHFGEYGIHDLDGLADAKLTVAQLVARDGLLVLNADDEWLRAKAAGLEARLEMQPPIGWFALDYDHPVLVVHRAAGGSTCGVHGGRLLLSHAGSKNDLGAVADMPLTVRGSAGYNISNIAGAALAAVASGIAPATIAAVFATFGSDPDDNAGRLMRFDVNGVHVLLDYAHNPQGLQGVLQVARSLCGEGARLAMLLGHAGNRRDEDLDDVAAVAASFAPDLIVIKENERHLRGREPGEVPAILRAAVLRHGVRESALALQSSEVDAARYALDWARPGDVLALLVHSVAARTGVLAMLKGK
jgi:UDP-N-acetylmuramyl tripeptide synthase